MKTFLEPLEELKVFSHVKKQIQKERLPVQISGCIDSQKCHMIYGLAQDAAYTVIVTYNEIKAKEILEDYKLFDRHVLYYPAKDVIFYNADIRGNAIVSQRLGVLKELLSGKKGLTIVTTIDAGMDFLLDLSLLEKSLIHLEEAQILELTDLEKRLAEMGYERCSQVESSGQFAVRGGILDIFPLTEESPYRIELWGDEIDTIRAFDAESQRSIENVKKLTIYPATEILLDADTKAAGLRKVENEKKKLAKQFRDAGKPEEAHRLEEAAAELRDNLENHVAGAGLESFISYFHKRTGSFFDYFDRENALFFMDEPGRCKERLEAVEFEFRESMGSRLEKGYILPGQMACIYSGEEIFGMLERKKLILLSSLDAAFHDVAVKETYALSAMSTPVYNNHFEMLVSDLKRYKDKKYRVLFLSSSRTRAERLSRDLNDNDIHAFYSEDLNRELQKGEIMTAYGSLHKGYEYPEIKFVVLSESDVFGGEKRKRKRRKKYSGKVIQSFNELNAGDYVVHENHGIGIYRGIEKIEVDKIVKDYIKIEYAGNGNLYVPATDVEVLQKFAGSEAKKPKLNKLNSTEWKNTKSRVRGAVREIARDLVELYAKRQEREGFAYSPDTVWQSEFEELFPFQETDDQLAAIAATKKDMESKKIMDRLICGDVGYGKTEIAIRAAFKAVSDNKQVAVLVPTTILAQQHYNTFLARLKDFPISVEMLSRFRTPTEQKKIISNLKKGQLDIVIGTHRLLSADVGFKDLGLLVIDEEQRFGVAHKEKIKKMKGDVDVLSLSATPIPRTLHMSLAGIRDMSVLEEAPVDRLPIQTFVLEHNGEMIREAINRELARNGQVYYVYNRVSNIDRIAAEVKELVPDAEVAFAHGQMSERELEKIMFRFIEGEIQVLVATTIIETGLDISNVNTMIIDDADKLGLSQLYQLRGRVGRSNRTAYAFLMYKRDKLLKETAEKRLQAIREFTELGSGFKVAMRDLEIRGAGNLLGAAQSGHMEAVGYDLYCKMLNDAVRRLKGEKDGEEDYATSVEMDVDAFIPSSYIRSEFQKLDMYKRISAVETEEEKMDLEDELTDRFGEIPPAAANLLAIALLKAKAHKVYMIQIKQAGEQLRFYMYPQAELVTERIPELIDAYRGKLKFVSDKSPYFLYNMKEDGKFKASAAGLLEAAEEIVGEIGKLTGERPAG